MYYPPPVAFPPPPPTSNTRSSKERAALVRSSKKLSKVLGDVPRISDGDAPQLSHAALAGSTAADAESIWRKRKPTHLPPLLKLSSSPCPSPSPFGGPDSPVVLTNPFATCHRRGSVLSIAPSIISNAPSTASGSSSEAATSDSTQRRIKFERLRRKLGDEVPATAIFPTSPYTAVPPTPQTATTPSTSKPKRPFARLSAQPHSPTPTDDARSITFSISSDESVHAVRLSAHVRAHSPHPSRVRQKHVYQTGPLPPVPPIPTHLVSSSSTPRDEDTTGLVRPRQKMAAGSKIGGSAFKAARRAKREGRAAEVGEMVEMVGFL